ncbi:MAG: AAA family ATPase [Bacteroidales bacterium]|nr:AAA family ATPase [Bacteroidales bacterium]
MAKRKFKLPGIDDLNKSQDRVLRLPEDGQFLVVGGPGTGKSVVALLRAMKFEKNKNYIFLTFNHVLVSATSQLVDIRLQSRTLKSWFYKLQYYLMKENMPQQENYKPDYDEVIKRFESLEHEERPLHIIIDEGQDIPVKFYEALISCGYENFFIVADQNQQITEDNSNRQELTDVLGLDVKDVIELTENFRNGYPIALFANEFFTDPSSPAPELPSITRKFGIPMLYEYKNYEDCVKLILREFDRDDRNLIGVVVANDTLRDTYSTALQSVEINLDNPRAIISTYSSKEKESVNINFSEGGIVVLNDKSIKGLEFDVVFIVIDGFKIYNNDIDSMKKRFYVMSSRAIKKLVLFKSEDYNSGVEQILPDDENILKREVLING